VTKSRASNNQSQWITCISKVDTNWPISVKYGTWIFNPLGSLSLISVFKNEKGRSCTCNVRMGRVRITDVAVEKQLVLHILSVSVALVIQHAQRMRRSKYYILSVSVALVIQHAKRMRRIVLSCVASLALLYFSTLSHKWHDFRKKVTDHKTCVLIFSTTFVWNISHSKNSSERYYHKYTYVCV
jgi:hypothetical protein